MAKLQYTEEGLPYYQAGENEPTGDDTVNPLYPVVSSQTIQSQAQSFALPVETPPELVYNPWEAVAARMRARQPIRQASPEDVAASQAPVKEYGKALIGENRYQIWPERMVRSAATLPGQVYSGEVDPLSEEGIQRAQDIAGMAGGGPLAMKAGIVSLGSGMVRQMGKQMTGEVAPTFFSTVEKAVSNAKQNSATAEQWLGFLKNQPGIRQEELAWTNLESLPKGQITKQQLEQHIADNKVRLNEVWKGGSTSDPDNFNSPKYSQWQLSGGNSYRELLLQLPERKGAQNKIINEGGYYKVLRPNGEKFGQYNKEWEAQAVADSFDRKEGNISETFKTSHWDEPNVLAHIRMNDRDIPGVGKSLHIEEIQSDFGQGHRRESIKIKEAINKDFDNITDRMIQAGVIKKICD